MYTGVSCLGDVCVCVCLQDSTCVCVCVSQRQLTPKTTHSQSESELSPRETWGAGVDIHTVDTLSSLFQFRTHFLVRFVPNKLPLQLAQLMVLNDM